MVNVLHSRYAPLVQLGKLHTYDFLYSLLRDWGLWSFVTSVAVV